jgi:hypothetical protein
MQSLGVARGITAGVWLGGAEAPTKLVDVGISPFAVSPKYLYRTTSTGALRSSLAFRNRVP